MRAQQHQEHPLEPLVRKLAYWTKLSEGDRAAVRALPYKLKSMDGRHNVVREGDVAQFASLMLSGFSIRHKIVGGGLRQIVGIHMKGDMVDLQNSLLGTADHSVEMLTAGQIAMIPREDIVRLAFENPAVGKAMWTDTLVDASIFREWIANVGRRNARTRIAHLLCEFAMRLELAGLGEHSDYRVPMNQEQLADATGLTSVHVNRMLMALEADGLITRSSPRSLIIGDWKRLVETADFDSSYLHLREGETVLA